MNNNQKIIKKDEISSLKEALEKEEQQKKKFIPKFTDRELIKESFKIAYSNWKYYLGYELTTYINFFLYSRDLIYKGKIIDSITKYSDYDKLCTACVTYLIFCFIKVVVMTTCFALPGYLTQKNNEDAALDLLNTISQKDLFFFDLFKIEEIKNLIASTSNKQHLYGNFVQFILFIIKGLLQFSYYTFFIYSLSPELLWCCFLLIILRVILYYINYYFLETNPRLSESRKNYDDYENVKNEFISKIRYLKSFSREKIELKKLYELKKKFCYYSDFSNLMQFWTPVYNLLNEIPDLILLITSGIQAVKGKVSYGDFIVLKVYATEYYYLFLDIYEKFKTYNSNLIVIRNFLEKYNFPNMIKCVKNIIPKTIQGNISFNNVSFCYPLSPDVEVLNNISFTIPSGKLVAFVGHSGGGKSTIANLMQRFYDPTKGTISLDDIDIKDLDIKWLRMQIGYVAQEPSLLSCNIEENITYGIEEYSKEDFDRVCRLAGVDRFALDRSLFPEEYKTLVGERGVKVSGGQKQRIAIARALLKKSKILILDEATSALDAELENEVRMSIDTIKKSMNITIIVIAHRLSTIKNADEILVLNKGSIKERGTHEELMCMNGEYKHLIEKQLVH